MNNGKKFSICLMNPPYDGSMHEKFLIKCIDISNKVISVQPANFLIGNKKNKELINKLQNTYYNINRENDASETYRRNITRLL